MTKKNNFRLGLQGLFTVLFFLLSACHRIPRISDYSLQGRSLSALEAQKINTALAQKSQELYTLRLLSRCELNYGDSNFAYRYAFVSERERGLRIEQLPLSGFYALATLVSAEGQTTVVFPSEKQAQIFAVGSDGLEALLGFSLPFIESDIGTILAGNLPQRFFHSEDQLAEGKNSIGTTLKNRQVFVSFSQSNQIQDAHFFSSQDGKEQIALHFEYDQERLPTLLSLYLPEQQLTLNCRSQQRDFNPMIKEGVFSVSIPSDYVVSSN
jgi:hypothetical protein